MIGYTLPNESVWQQGKQPWPVSQSSFEVSTRNITQCFCGCAWIRTESSRNTNETVYCFSSSLGITDVDSPTVVRKNSKSKLCYFVITNIARLTHVLNIVPSLFLVNEDVSKAGSASFIMSYHESLEITNKMQPCNRIYYFNVYWRLNMFRAAYRSSSGALNCVCSLWFTYTCCDWPLSSLSGKNFPLRLDNGRSPHVYINQRLQIQFRAPDDERYAVRNMLSLQ